MKKRLLLLSSLLSIGITTKAQWVIQNSSFTANSRGIGSITIQNDQTAWAVAYDGSGSGAKIQEFTMTSDGGATWKPGKITVAGTGSFGIANISAINKDTAWACIFDEGAADPNQGIYRTNDGGTTWNRQAGAAYGNGSFPDIVYFWDKNNGLVFGDPLNGFFEVYTTKDGGATWALTPNTNNQLTPAPASDEYGITNAFTTFGGDIWVATDHGRIFKSSDKGLTWTVATTPLTSTVTSTSPISGVAFRDAKNGLAYKYNSTSKKAEYIKTTDGGATWTSVTSTGFNFGTDFCAVPGSNKYISVGSATGFKGTSMSTDDGATWQLLEDTTKVPQRTAVAFLNENLGYAGGFNGGTGITPNPAIEGMNKWTGALIPYVSVKSINNSESAVLVYPNPSNGLISLSLKGFAGKNTQVKIFNVVGEQVYSSENTYSTPIYTKHIDLNYLPQGVYIVSVFDGANNYMQRIVKN